MRKNAIINCDGAQDAVNNFLKTASKLTSIEENSELSSGKNKQMPKYSKFGTFHLIPKHNSPTQFTHITQVGATQSQQCDQFLEFEAV